MAARESTVGNDGGEGNMIPATEVSIRPLKTAAVPSESSESESCMICLKRQSCLVLMFFMVKVVEGKSCLSAYFRYEFVCFLRN